MKGFARIFASLLAVLLTLFLILCAVLVLRTPFFHPWRKDAVLQAPAPTVAPTVQTEPMETEPPETEPPAPASRSFLLTFAGSCVLGSSENHIGVEAGFRNVVGEDYGYPFRNVADIFAGDEATFLNLENPLCDQSHPSAAGTLFRGAESYVNILAEGSVEAVSLANNHSLDHGQIGYDTTCKALEEAGIPYAQRDKSTLLTTENGLTIGIYAAVYYLMKPETVVQAIAELRPACDILIFAPHWGSEYSYRQNKTQTELAHAAIDAGADFVWGTHPAVLQPMEAYNGRYICYSLGNFCFGGSTHPREYDTALVQLEVTRHPDGTLEFGALTQIPCSVSSAADRNDFCPTPYPDNSADYMRTMTKLEGTYHLASLPLN